jgi:hypothetical protein
LAQFCFLRAQNPKGEKYVHENAIFTAFVFDVSTGAAALAGATPLFLRARNQGCMKRNM